jgi:hypothetical protein
MAAFIESIVKYGAKLKLQPTVRLEELAERIAELTGLRTSQVISVLLELSSALVHYNRRGYALELPGLGFFRPSLRNSGKIRILYRPDQSLTNALGTIDQYRGEVENPQNLGLGPLELKALWDAEHPDDLLELPFGFEDGEAEQAA